MASHIPVEKAYEPTQILNTPLLRRPSLVKPGLLPVHSNDSISAPPNDGHTTKDEISKDDDREFKSHTRRRTYSLRPPLDFRRLEGKTDVVFPMYLSDDVEQYIRTNGTAPVCARRKHSNRYLERSDEKLGQYRKRKTQEILLAGLYECRGRQFVMVRAQGNSTCLDKKCAILGACDKARGDFHLPDGTNVCVSYYYIWTSHSRPVEAEIEKWTWQSLPKNREIINEQYPARRPLRSDSRRTKSIDRVGAIDSPDRHKSNTSSREIPHQPCAEVSAEPSVLSIVEDHADGYTDESDVEEVVPIRQARSPNRRAKCQRDRSKSASSPTPKRQRARDLERWSPPPEGGTPFPQQRTLLQLRDNSTEAIDRQSRGPQSLLLTEHKPSFDSNSKAPQALEPVSEPDHSFVFKAHVVDKGVYPPKNFESGDEVSLLFAHAAEAGIADKSTTVLLLQSREQKWTVIRRDKGKFAEVLEWLRKKQVSQRIVVTPKES